MFSPKEIERREWKRNPLYSSVICFSFSLFTSFESICLFLQRIIASPIQRGSVLLQRNEQSMNAADACQQNAASCKLIYA